MSLADKSTNILGDLAFNLLRSCDVPLGYPSFSWQAELILGIHDRVMAGSYASGAGRFRQGPVFLAISGESRAVYELPPAEIVPELVSQLADFVQTHTAGIPAPVLAALLHARLAGIHPFSDGNGRTARVLASLAMYRGGLTRPEFTSLEEWWGAHRAEYYDAFACLGASWREDADVTPFIAAHVRAASRLLVASGAGRSRSYTGGEALLSAVAKAARLTGMPSASPVPAQRQWVLARLAERVAGL